MVAFYFLGKAARRELIESAFYNEDIEKICSDQSERVERRSTGRVRAPVSTSRFASGRELPCRPQ